MKINLQFFAGEPLNKPAGEEGQDNGKTFTQEDVNRIVSKRLAEEKAKSEASLLEREKALEKRELTLKAKEVLRSKNLPDELLDVIAYTDEKSLMANIDILDKLYSPKEEIKIVGCGTGVPASGTASSTNDDYQIRGAMKLSK